MSLKLFVEGGGDHNKTLAIECRRGFREFLERSGLAGRMPRIVACGGRDRAYRDFREAQQKNERAFLLVDSEGPVDGTDPWLHVRNRPGDGWERPSGASDDQLHLMVQAMEAWFFADPDELARLYGEGFRSTAMTQRSDIERIPKADLVPQLEAATAQSKKGKYSKSRHSFEILSRIDPNKVRSKSEWADRLLSTLALPPD